MSRTRAMGGSRWILARRYAVPIAVVCVLAVITLAAPPIDPTPEGGAPGSPARGLAETPAAARVVAGDSAVDQNTTTGSGRGARDTARSATQRLSASGMPGAVRTGIDKGAERFGGPGAARGDRSRCGEGGVWQQDITEISPPCLPHFRGDNGGATAPGVTRTSVRVVVLRDDYGPYVEPVLQTAGVAASPEEEAAAMAAFAKFFAKHYEWYGREVEWIYHRASCEMNASATCAVAEAKAVVARYRPFAVVVPLPNRAEFFSAMTRKGVVTVGGWHLPRSTFAREAPYRYDWVPDGTRVMRGLADYWCAKLAGKPASRAGDAALHGRTRRLGIVVPADSTGRSHAAELSTMIRRACGGAAKPPVVYRYSGDYAQSQDQFAAIVESMRTDDVTTVTCLCDPVRPIFLTSAADLHGYFPEHLLSGMYATDLDVFGRLYSQTQWANAFGPVLQPPAVPRAEQDDYRAYEDVGAPYSCYPCLATFTWMHLAAIQLQLAGPHLTVTTYARGTVNGPGVRQSADPAFPRVGFGPGRFTAMLDAREVSWSPSSPSAADGRAGSYVCVERDCRRYRPGQWPRGEPSRP